jgi:dihydrofolate reductase
MAKLIYFMPTSLDGYIADETGDPNWAAPDEEVFAFINDLVRPIGMLLYGRKMYETMAIWETPDVIPNRTPAILDFAQIWQAADKIVYSKSLETAPTPKTRLEREFDPQAVCDLKAQLPHDVSVAGPTLAAHAIRTGLINQYHLLVVPITLGGGKRVPPSKVC